jgi:hypothetical protein
MERRQKERTPSDTLLGVLKLLPQYLGLFGRSGGGVGGWGTALVGLMSEK